MIKEYKTINIEKKIPEDIFCNKCGESLKAKSHIGHYLGLIEAKVCGEYYSTDLEDMVSYTFSVCEKCLVEFFDSFKHDAKEVEENFG